MLKLWIIRIPFLICFDFVLAFRASCAFIHLHLLLHRRHQRQEQLPQAVVQAVLDAVLEQLDDGGDLGAVVRRQWSVVQPPQEVAAGGLHVAGGRVAARRGGPARGRRRGLPGGRTAAGGGGRGVGGGAWEAFGVGELGGGAIANEKCKLANWVRSRRSPAVSRFRSCFGSCSSPAVYRLFRCCQQFLRDVEICLAQVLSGQGFRPLDICLRKATLKRSAEREQPP